MQLNRNKLLLFISLFICLIPSYTHCSHNTKGIEMTVYGISENSIVHLREKNGEWLVLHIIKNGDITYHLKKTDTDTDKEMNVTLQDIIPNK
ncbi:hypothetical protein [Escherichia sp. MOD1-EC5350]|uniref:hypothetical protein n=1 Tax=Escherichia sp. MOD1-EC5350 TaxID=2093866 RepID=UPI0013001A2E|nr:hypothetical protein [Escherichia sp. MOD1-EC5350]